MHIYTRQLVGLTFTLRYHGSPETKRRTSIAMTKMTLRRGKGKEREEDSQEEEEEEKGA